MEKWACEEDRIKERKGATLPQKAFISITLLTVCMVIRQLRVPVEIISAEVHREVCVLHRVGQADARGGEIGPRRPRFSKQWPFYPSRRTAHAMHHTVESIEKYPGSAQACLKVGYRGVLQEVHGIMGR